MTGNRRGDVRTLRSSTPMAPQFPHGKIRQNRGAKCPSPSPQGFLKSLTREGQEFCPEWQGNDKGSSKSCGPQLSLRGFPVMNPKLRMTSVPRPGPRGGSSGIWPQRSRSGSGAERTQASEPPSRPRHIPRRWRRRKETGWDASPAGKGEAGPGRATRDASPASGSPAGGQRPACGARPKGKS